MNTQKSTFQKILTGIAFSSLCVAFTSSATPITSWDFIVDTAFTSAAYTTGTGTPTATNTNTLFNAPTTLSWGESVQSSLDVSSGNNGTVAGTGLASGTPVQTSLLTHNNIAIDGDSSVLLNATLSTVLQLVPNGVPLPLAVLPPALAFNVFFKETPNNSSCSYIVVPCSNDIFVMTMPLGVSFNAGTGTVNQQFTIGQYTYNTELKIVGTTPGSGLAVLSDDICARVPGAGNGCIGLTTVEGLSNNFQTLMTISTIPEPTTILLLSLALFGIAASSRNKHI
jgi:hypothetical protein